MKRMLILVTVFAMAMMSSQAMALIVTTTGSGTDLVDAILGTGINASNIVYSGANTAASGTFTSGGNIGFASGALLTTGYAAGAVGPNTSGSYTGPGTTTSLAFDFTFGDGSAGGDLYFNYVFASEEYNEYVGSIFNDLFELNVDGNNVALIPGTSTPIKINNVNLSTNSTYYRNNSGAALNSIDTQYDGLTTVLQASALGLAAGTHTMQFLIADVGDSAFDSGVFIQGGTFSDVPTPPDGTVPEPSTLWLLGSGVLGLIAYRRTRRMA